MNLQSDAELSRGVLPELLNGDVTDNDPVLQLVVCHRIDGQPQKNLIIIGYSTGTHYISYRCLDESNGELVQRLTLSDGMHTTAFVVTGGDLLEKESLKPFSVFQLIKYECVKVYSEKRTRTVLLIHDLSFISQHSKIIGDPKDLDAAFATADEAMQSTESTIVKTEKLSPNLKTNLQPAQVSAQTTTPPVEEQKTWRLEPLYPNLELCKTHQKPPPGRIFKISELIDGSCPRDFIIRAKVMNKMPVKSLFRGQVFSLNLADDTGAINACAFDGECDKFKSLFEIGHVYWVAGGFVRTSKETKGKSQTTYEIKMQRQTNVIECFDTSGLPSIDFNFTPLDDIRLQDKRSLVDLCGICITASELFIHNGSINHKMLVIISPPTGNTKVEIDIWGKYAEEFDASTNPVIVIKNCKISSQWESNSLMGASLYLDPLSVFLVDPPNCPIVKSYKNWYAGFVGKQINEKIITSVEVPIPVVKNFKDVVIEAASFMEAKSRLEALKDQIVYVKSFVTVIETDPQYLMTLTCTTCKRQVFDLNLEKLVCSNCGYVDGGNIRSLFTRIRVGDEIVNEWVSIADMQLKKALGIASPFMEGNSTEHWEALRSLVGKKFYVHLKYDRNDLKVPCVVVEIDPALENSMTFSQLSLF